MSVTKGDRIQLLLMPNDPHPIEPGTKGTVMGVTKNIWNDGSDQIAVEWDNGRALSLVSPPDSFLILDEKA